MGEIKVGQIWIRRSPKDGLYFPSKGWKVKIVSVLPKNVIHSMVEYDGEPRSEGRLFIMNKIDFLSLYYLEE